MDKFSNAACEHFLFSREIDNDDDDDDKQM